MSIRSSLLTVAKSIHPTHPYWKAVLTTGHEVSERGMTFDLSRGGFRPIDWSLDLITTGDILKIKELHLCMPRVQPVIRCIEKDGIEEVLRPWGADYVVLPIREKGCAFQMKIKTIDRFIGNGDVLECQMIGTIINKEEGTCVAYICDRVMGLIEYKTSIYNFGTWREGIAPISNISQSVIGLNLA